MSLTSYLAAEALIVARLQSKVPGPRVLTAADLQSRKAQAAFVPDEAGALVVIYDGDVEVTKTDKRSPQATVVQRWFIVVWVKQAGSLASGAAARAAAGGLLLAVHKALDGWRPAPETGHLARAAGGTAEYEGTFAAFPLAFTLPVPLTGTG